MTWKLNMLCGLAMLAKPSFCDDPQDCVDGKVVGFGSPDSCQMANLMSKPLRIAFLDEQYATTNPAAIRKANSLGMTYVQGVTCDDEQTAVPECFVASNWNAGWMGQFMWGVFSNYLGLSDSNIVAMTTLNFSMATKPNSPGSVYNGSSSYTRCVHEIRLGNIDLCVGDFWETEERRDIAVFTTVIAVDQFLLVTKLMSDSTSSTLVFSPLLNDGVMAKIFQPLAMDVWLAHVGLMALAGIVLFFIEGTRSYLFLGEGREAIERDDKESEPPEWNWNGLLNAAYSSLIHFLWNAPQYSPRTVGGMLAQFGICAHTLILTASYTASLAAFLASPTYMQKEVSSFNEVAQLSPKFESNVASFKNLKAGKLCVLQSAQGLFSSLLDPNQIVGVDNYGPMFEMLYSDQCGSAVTGRNEFLTFIQAEQMTFSVCANQSDPNGFISCADGKQGRTLSLDCQCNSTIYADPITCPEDCPDYHRYRDIVLTDQEGFDQWYNWALPVSTDFAEIISYAILQSRMTNDFFSARSDQLLDKVTAKYSLDGSDMASDDKPIGVSSFVGLYTLVIILIGSALALRLFMLILEQMRDAHLKVVGNAGRKQERADNDEVAEVSHSSGNGGKDKGDFSSQFDDVFKKLGQLREQLQRLERAADAPSPPALGCKGGERKSGLPAAVMVIMPPKAPLEVGKLSNDEQLFRPTEFVRCQLGNSSGASVAATAVGLTSLNSGDNDGAVHHGPSGSDIGIGIRGLGFVSSDFVGGGTSGGDGSAGLYDSQGSMAVPAVTEPRRVCVWQPKASQVEAYDVGNDEARSEARPDPNLLDGFVNNMVCFFAGQSNNKT